MAFSQARALVKAVGRESLKDYAAAHRRIMRLPRRLTDLLLIVEDHRRLRRLAIRTFATFPALFSESVDMIGRSGAAVEG